MHDNNLVIIFFGLAKQILTSDWAVRGTWIILWFMCQRVIIPVAFPVDLLYTYHNNVK